MRNLQRGQTMVEAIVALVIILIIITAIAVVITNGLYNAQFIKNQNEANKYAQQGMEVVRNIQQNDLAQFASLDATYCINDTNSTLYSDGCSITGVNTGKYYNRTVVFSQGASPCAGAPGDIEETKVTVTVAWSSSKCDSTNTFCHKSVLQACLPSKVSGSSI